MSAHLTGSDAGLYFGDPGKLPLLKRSQIYGAIAFYLDHQAEIDKYLEDTEREFEASAIPLVEADPVLWEKIQRARATMDSSHA